MTWNRRDMKVAAFAERLMCEFPEWTTTEAVTAAERIVDTAEQMSFQMDVERDLDALPVYGEVA